jgi:hypothetical protein
MVGALMSATGSGDSRLVPQVLCLRFPLDGGQTTCQLEGLLAPQELLNLPMRRQIRPGIGVLAI